MRTGIVFKLFGLTTALCMFILATMFIGQTIFFKQFYANKKVATIQSHLQSFKTDYVNSGGDVHAIQKLEQQFYQECHTWVTTLDQWGNVNHTRDYQLEVQLDHSLDPALSNQTLLIPLYSLLDIEDAIKGHPFIRAGKRVVVNVIHKDDAFIPYRFGLEDDKLTWENSELANKDHETYSSSQTRTEYGSRFPTLFLDGTITRVQIPEGEEATRFIYTNQLFMNRIKQFQADLLFAKQPTNLDAPRTINYEKNDVNYTIFVHPITNKEGMRTYIFAMTSLQPVDEAVQIIKDYYLYLIMIVLLLILLTSFYYSKRIAQPLLQINHMTQKIANLDFSKKIPVTSKDELGVLSQNINRLSDTLHSHINQLQQDIEQEKKLENTRKEFIAGVSHELKTPLSVIKSCISILKDDIASHKREYYFQAMENEVEKMNRMIVDMLELAKFESGTYRMEMDTFYIDVMINHICAQLPVEMANKQLRLHTRLDPIQVIANQHRIEQVVTNFITNAIRYTPDEGVIAIFTEEDRDNVKIGVENKGVHIEDTQLEKIWDRFYRGDTSRNRSTGGTGLGLAISKQILELHGVAYGVSNTEDGVLFYFYLPKLT